MPHSRHRFFMSTLSMCLALSCFWGCGDEASTAAPAADGSVADGGVTPDAAEDAAAAPSDAAPPGEQVEIPGLTAPVTVRFDPQGMLHVECASDDDCIAAQGYYHAAHRFLQMDLNRRFPQGRLGERVGAYAQSFDHGNRKTIATIDGERIEDQMWDAADPATRTALEAYTRGVNAWLADLRAERNGAALAEEYDFAIVYAETIDDWTPKDSLICTMLLVRSLTDSSGTEIRWGQLTQQLPEAIAADVLSQEQAYHSAVIPPENDGVTKAGRAATGWWMDRGIDLMPVLAQAEANLPLPLFDDKGDFGSNNWVVGPERSSVGRALLSNDPHLGLRNPGYWYLAHLDSKTNGAGSFKVAGMSFPGLPGVVIGRNEHIAWGMTTTYFDASDVYVETLSDDGTGVMFNGEVVPFMEKTYTFDYADAPSEEVSFKYVPHHGPVIAEDEEAGTALTLRWTGTEVDTDANYLLALAKASNVAEAKDALRNLTAIGQNVVVADVHGDIGWFPYNRLPKRPWASEYPPWLPLPGTGEAEWGTWINYDALPQLENPAAGYIATANNDMTGASFDGDPTNDGVDAIQVFLRTGYRHGRIVQRLEATDQHDLASMESIVGDVYSLYGAETLPEIFAALDRDGLDESGARVLAALEAWQFDCPTGLDGLSPTEAMPVADPVVAAESIGCTAFHVLLGRLFVGAFRDELEAAEVGYVPGHRVMVRLLKRPEAMVYGAQFWDNVETEDVVEDMTAGVTTAMNAAGAWLDENMGEDPDTWRWGRIHTMTLAAPLFSDAGVADYNYGPFANDGGIATVDVARCDGTQSHIYSHGSGPSVRFTCDLTEPPTCTLQYPGGQRHRRAGEHYNDLLPGWLTNEPFAMPFTPAEVAAATVSTVALVPSP